MARPAPDARWLATATPSLIRRAEQVGYNGPAAMLEDGPIPSITVRGRTGKEAAERGEAACRALGVSEASSAWSEAPDGGWILTIRVAFPR